MIESPGFALPTEVERRQIFHTLKRWSSYTAWNRILGLYQAWANSIENSLREAGERGLEDKTDLPEKSYISILEGLAHCEKGVSRLRKGDKRVFRSNFQGDFEIAFRGSLDHWASMLGPYGRIAIGENGIRQDVTPHWAEFARAGWELVEAWGECSPDVIEPEPRRSNATHTFINDALRAELARMAFPAVLEDVPDSTEVHLVNTGNDVLCTGVWEPVDVPARKLLSLFKAPVLDGPLPVRGTISYLHGGSTAPPMASYGKIEGAATTWRLLWRDDRYLDGSIPEEEASYVFLYPEAPRSAAPAAPEVASITVLASGMKTPVAGRWALQDDLNVSITLEAGEVLPGSGGRPARWVLSS